MRVREWLERQAMDPGFLEFMAILEKQRADLTSSVMNSEEDQPLKRGRAKGIDWVLRLPGNLTKDGTKDET